MAGWAYGDRKKEDFVDWQGETLNKRLDGLSIVDVKLHADDFLEIFSAKAERPPVISAQLTLYLRRGKAAGRPERRSAEPLFALKNGILHTCPEFVFVRICEDDGWGEYAGCSVKHVLFDEGLRGIEGEILADNPSLETVVIPASVRYVDWSAFGGCTGLKKPGD